MKHVAWPTQRQTYVFTALVIAISLFTAAYLGLFDFVFTRTLEAGLRATGASQQLPETNAHTSAESTDSELALPEGVDFSVEPVSPNADGTEQTETPLD